MNRWILLLILPIILGCSSSLSDPVCVDNGDPGQSGIREAFSNHWMWGQYNFHVNVEHSKVTISPLREAQYHYNVKMLLENGPCYNCIKIKYLINNGDGTINLGVTLRHPYPFNQYFTGFDVKGIVVFPAHFEIRPNFKIPLRDAGDPELLNEDGYCQQWEVWDEIPHKKLPIERYQPGGKLGGGITWGDIDDPDSTWHGFKYYHSSENRRYFEVSDELVRDYHIYIPPGEWDFGYSVDACWAQPLNNPVSNVPDDFPIWANCMANYHLEAEISGELSGYWPAPLTVDVWNHMGSGCQDYLQVHNAQLFYDGYMRIYKGLVDMGSHERWDVGVWNQKQAPPGWYKIGVISHVDLDKYPVPPGDHDIGGWPGTMQVVDVCVAE